MIECRSDLHGAKARGDSLKQNSARRLGLTQSQLSRWERGVVEPSLETLRRIVRACGLELTLGLANGDDSYDARYSREPRARSGTASRPGAPARGVHSRAPARGLTAVFDPYRDARGARAARRSLRRGGRIRRSRPGLPAVDAGPRCHARPRPGESRAARECAAGARSATSCPAERTRCVPNRRGDARSGNGVDARHGRRRTRPRVRAGRHSRIRRRASTMPSRSACAGSAVRLASLRDVIRMKEAAGREKDMLHAPGAPPNARR